MAGTSTPILALLAQICLLKVLAKGGPHRCEVWETAGGNQRKCLTQLVQGNMKQPLEAKICKETLLPGTPVTEPLGNRRHTAELQAEAPACLSLLPSLAKEAMTASHVFTAGGTRMAGVRQNT